MRNSYLQNISMVVIIVFVSLFLAPAEGYSLDYQEQVELSQNKAILFDRPDPEGVPTKVYIGLYLLDLISIDDVNQSFTADVFAMVRWNDPRLALKNPSESQILRNFDLEEIWHPMTYIINQRRISRQLDNIFRVDPAGNVQYIQRFLGDFSCPLDFKDFPFDKQKLALQVVSFRYGPEEVEFVLDQKRTGRRGQLSLVGWFIGQGQSEVTTEYLQVQDRHLARVDFMLDVKRQRPFYIIKALIPLILIIFMAWSVFFIDPSVIGPQIGIPTSSVFALILFNHRMSALLPRVSYLTRIDRFILFSIILVFITLGESVITATLAQKEKKELALKIDHWSRYLYLLLFVAVLVYSFVL
ncbi:MAG: hypothetical protein PVH84_11485 [Candidatus Aminicenantes bacterium]